MHIFRPLLCLLAACSNNTPIGDSSGAPDPEFGDVVGSHPAPGSLDVAATADIVFLCLGEDGVGTYRVGDPSHAQAGESFVTPGACRAVASIGGWLFTGDTSGSFSIRHPANGLTKGEHVADFPIEAFSISPGTEQVWLAGVGKDVGGIERIDIGNQGNIKSRASAELALAGGPDAVIHDGSNLVLATEDGEIQIHNNSAAHIDSWIPDAAQLPDHKIGGMAIIDRTLYVPLGTPGVAMIHLDNPSAAAPMWTNGHPVTAATAVGDRLYLAAEQEIIVLDAADPAALVEIGRGATGAEGHTPTAIAVAGDHTYVVDGTNLWIVYTPVEG